MANWKININGKNLRRASVEKLLQKLKDEFGIEWMTVTDNTPPDSRAERFAAAKVTIEEAKADLETLRDELQDWFDGMPENFQNGQKGDALQEAVSNLEEVISHCEDVESTEVEFPGMY